MAYNSGQPCAMCARQHLGEANLAAARPDEDRAAILRTLYLLSSIGIP